MKPNLSPVETDLIFHALSFLREEIRSGEWIIPTPEWENQLEGVYNRFAVMSYGGTPMAEKKEYGDEIR